jgi:hypothetical protein
VERRSTTQSALVCVQQLPRNGLRGDHDVASIVRSRAKNSALLNNFSASNRFAVICRPKPRLWNEDPRQLAITVSMMLPKVQRAQDVAGEICS